MTNKNNESTDFWPIKTIKNWDEFEEIVSKHRYREWVYRGQSDALWEVNSSLYRLYDEINFIFKEEKGRDRKLAKKAHEKLLVEKFMSHAPIYINHLPERNNDLEILSIMQHFGAPTRLIDVTFSSAIAMYFALESGKGDAAIFALKPKYYKEIDTEELNFEINGKGILNYEKEEDAFFIAYEPIQSNERLLAQQGLFLVPSKISEPFKNILGDYSYTEKECVKYILPSRLRQEGLKRLRKINITSAVLFPGLDGFCRSLRHQVVDTTQQLRRMG